MTDVPLHVPLAHYSRAREEAEGQRDDLLSQIEGKTLPSTTTALATATPTTTTTTPPATVVPCEVLCFLTLHVVSMLWFESMWRS